jgi:D-3-phosphoglycerate dehydrogenase
MLSKINELFSRSDVNVDAQYLQTSGQIGYVVIDITASDTLAEELKDKLSAIDGTLRTRLLY